MKDFHVKLKVKFEFFTRDFPGKKMKWKKFLKGFLLKIEAEGKKLKGYLNGIFSQRGFRQC